MIIRPDKKCVPLGHKRCLQVRKGKSSKPSRLLQIIGVWMIRERKMIHITTPLMHIFMLAVRKLVQEVWRNQGLCGRQRRDSVPHQDAELHQLSQAAHCRQVRQLQEHHSATPGHLFIVLRLQVRLLLKRIAIILFRQKHVVCLWFSKHVSVVVFMNTKNPV